MAGRLGWRAGLDGWLLAHPCQVRWQAGLDGWHGVKRAMDLWSKDCSQVNIGTLVLIFTLILK